MNDPSQFRDVAESAWGWVLDQVRWDNEGVPWIPLSVDDDGNGEPDEFPDSLHSGIAGLAPVLAEIRLARDWTHSERELAAGIVTTLTAHARDRVEPCYFLGLAGDATALHLLDPGSEEVPLRRLLDLATEAGWPSTVFDEGADAVTDLVLGNAGIALTAVWTGHRLADEIMTIASQALVESAVEDASGARWYLREGQVMEMPNYSHGAAGIASALCTAGHRLGRTDWIQTAIRGAEHVIAAADLSDGMRIPIVIPYGNVDYDEYTYTWCHGPTGTSYLFLALHEAGVREVSGRAPLDWHAQCLQAVASSGVPRRLRPGFWDNDGRCCGTAGVGEMYLDDAQRQHRDPGASGESLRLSGVMADALLDRAITDRAGTRWRFIEHRNDPPLLPPGTGWMQGAAGIAAFLMRMARVRTHGLDAARVTRPDSLWG